MGQYVPDETTTFSSPGEKSHPGVRGVRWTPIPDSGWTRVEVWRTGDAEFAELGVSGVNRYGETITSFAELLITDTFVDLYNFTDEPIFEVHVERPDLASRDDAAMYLHMVRLFYLGDATSCRPENCDHIRALGSRLWRWSSAIDSAVMVEAFRSGKHRN